MGEDTGLGAQAHIGRKVRNIAPELWDEISGTSDMSVSFEALSESQEGVDCDVF